MWKSGQNGDRPIVYNDLVNRELVEKIPQKYTEQFTFKMDEKSRDILAEKLHGMMKEEIVKAGFEIVDSKFRGKSDSSLNMKLKMFRQSNEKPIIDLCGMRYVLNTNEEIDELVKWFRKNYQPPEKYNFGGGWINDFRDENFKKEVEAVFMQPDYRAVHVRLPFEYENQVDFMEIQLVTVEQEKINQSNREAFEKARRQNLDIISL
jgi:hypothetical protein